MSKQIIFKGCGTAIVTPFTKERNINYYEYQKLLEYQIKNNCDAIIVCGTTGESSTLTFDEKKEIIDFTVKVVKHRIPVLAGTGSNNTSFAIELSQFAEMVGCDGVLVVTPYYNKTTQRGLVEHYNAIAKSISIPLVLYNVPARTGLNIEPDTCFELSKTENIVAIKEASGNISQIAKIAALCGDNLYIYSGNDDQIVPIMSLGGIGVVSVLSNIYPNYVHEITQNFFSKNIDKALKMQLDAMDLIENLFSEVNPIPVKEALNSLDFNVGPTRLPLVNMSESKEKINFFFRSIQKLVN